jgi:ribosomal protein S3AE
MAKVVVKSKVKKVKRKYPVEIVAPEYLESVKLGKSQTVDLQAFLGKAIKINMMYVTGNVKNQNIRLTFRVVEVDSGKALTVLSKYEQIPYYLGRFIKAGSNLIEDSYEFESKDKKKILIKPMMVTKNKVSRTVLSSLRLKSRELFQKEISSKTYDEFIASLIGAKVQNSFRNELKKIFPLKTFEFKKVELLN